MTMHTPQWAHMVPQADIRSQADFLLLFGFKLPTQVLRHVPNLKRDPYKPLKPLQMAKTGEK